VVEVLEVGVEQGLGDLAHLGAGLGVAAQAIQQQHHVQAVDLEAALGRVGGAEVLVERRRARLAHSGGVQRLAGLPGRTGSE
jgi:hypothetical protein